MVSKYEEKMIINAGSPDSRDIYKKRSQIITIDGSDEIHFNGTQAWNKPVKIDSCPSYLSHPLNYISGDSFFHRGMKRNLVFEKDKIETQLQLSVNHLTWSQDNFAKNTTTYDSYIQGINNLERFYNIPVIASLPYFGQVPFINKISKEKLSIDGQQLSEKTVQEPYFNVERFSGFTFSYLLPFQYSTVIKKEGLLRNMVDENFAIPLVVVEEEFKYSDHEVRIELI